MTGIEILRIASGIGSVIGLIAFGVGVLGYIATRREARSLRSILSSANPTESRNVLKILKSYKDDQARLEALQSILSYDSDVSADILKKTKKTVDLQSLSKAELKLSSITSLSISLLVTIICAIAAFALGNGNGGVNAGLIQECRESAVEVTDSCRAFDRSGFHSSPSATCNLSLVAPEGRFFAEREVEVVSEGYRNVMGVGAKDAMKPTYQDIDGVRLPVNFAGQIGCTNAQGTGRTCEATAEVRLLAYLNKCASVARELRN